MESLLETHTLPIFDSRVGLRKEKRTPRTDVADTKYNLNLPRSGLSGSVRDGAAEQSRATPARGREKQVRQGVVKEEHLGGSSKKSTSPGGCYGFHQELEPGPHHAIAQAPTLARCSQKLNRDG